VTVPVEVDVASGRSILSAQNDCRIRQQSFEALPWTAAPERLIQKTRRECELVTLAGQTKRLNFAQRQQTVQIVTTTERSRPFKWDAAADFPWLSLHKRYQGLIACDGRLSHIGSGSTKSEAWNRPLFAVCV